MLDEWAGGGSWRRTWWNVPFSLSLSLLFGGSVHDGFRPKRALPVVTRAIRRSHRNICSRAFVASWTLVMLSSAVFCADEAQVAVSVTEIQIRCHSGRSLIP